MSRFQRLRESKFVRDTFMLQIGRIGTTALSFVSFWLIVRLMGVEAYGIWKLVLAFVGIWQAFDITGIGQLTSTRLAIAVGRKDSRDVLDLMAIYVKVVLVWALISVVVLFALGPLVGERLYDRPPLGSLPLLASGRGLLDFMGLNDTGRLIGTLAGWYALSIAADTLYTLVIVSLQSRRLMRQLALLQNLNQVVLFVCMVVAVLVDPRPESLLVGRLVYSYSTLALAFYVYARLRAEAGVTFPPLGAVFRRAAGVSLRGYWRTGMAMAFDKNIANLYTQVPITLVGVLAGPAAAGTLGVGLDVVTRSSLLTGPVLENVQAVVPQAVGRGDFAGLRRNFGRVLVVMAAGATAFYVALALAAPLVVPLVFGEDTAPAVPVVVILSFFGVITAVGGLFGPLYRAFDLMRSALTVKIIAGLALIVPGLWLISQHGAVGGAWLINGLYLLSVVLTAAITLPPLWRRAASANRGV